MSYINETDIALPCGHRGWTWYGWKSDGRGGYVLGISLESCVAKKCATCDHWLSLGPANDTPETAVEVRAAEIAAAGIRCRHSTENDCVYCGWVAHEIGEHLSDGAGVGLRAGYLARCIATHGENE